MVDRTKVVAKEAVIRGYVLGYMLPAWTLGNGTKVDECGNKDNRQKSMFGKWGQGTPCL